MTELQKTILSIAEDAKKNGLDPVEAVQEYFDEKDSHFSRAKVAYVLGIAREASRKGEEVEQLSSPLTYRNVTINRIPEELP